MRFRLALVGLLPILLAPLAAQDILISHGDMYRNSDGRIDYRLVARVPTYMFKPTLQAIKNRELDDETQGTWVLLTLEQTLRTKHAYWVAPWGVYEPRPLTRAQVLAAGVTQNELNLLDAQSEKPVDRTLYPITFTEESRMVSTAPAELYSGIRAGDRRTGDLNLFATLPLDHPGGRWGLTVTNALGEERSLVLTLAPGLRHIRIAGLEAGNCLVKLFALSAAGQASTYFQEVPVIVRKNQPGVARIEFKAGNDATRYQIASLALGQNSQVQGEGEAPLPLQEGKDAMVRIMVADRYGAGGAGSLLCEARLALEWQGSVLWSTSLDTKARPTLAKTGRSNDLFSQVGPIIPGALLKPGSLLRATLIDKATGQVLHQATHTPTIIRPRHIVIHGYDVRPRYNECKWSWGVYVCYPVWGSGVPLARNEAEMKSNVIPYIQDAFPFSTIEYKFEGRVWLDMAARGLTFSTQVHMLMQEIQGRRETNPNAAVEHIYMGMINSSYGSVSTPGMAWYGYRGMAITNCKDYQGMGYLIAHELGHNFKLEHAPSEGANGYVAGLHLNRVDADYSYGGAGLTGGWGYSKQGTWFLSEDSHAVYNRNPHWDVMSYTLAGARTFRNTNVSDYFCRKYLIPTWAYRDTSEGMIAAAPEGPADYGLTAERVQGSVPIFGDAAAEETSAWIRALGFQPDPLAASGVDWDQVDPSQGTPDDPTPPVAIFKRMPTASTPGQ